MVHGTPAHVKCYSYHAGTDVIDRNLEVYRL